MNTDTQHSSTPKVSFNDADVKRFATDDKLKAGTRTDPLRYAFLVTGEKRMVDEKTGNLVVLLTCKPMKDPDDASSVDRRFTEWVRVTMPIANPEIDGHRAPKNAGQQAARTLAAIVPDRVVAPPTFINKRLTFKGEPIDKKQETAALEESISTAMQYCVDWFNGSETVKDKRFFAALNKNGEYRNVEYLTSELPEGAELVDSSDFGEG